MRLKDLYKEGIFASFSDICENFYLSQVFRYFQICQFIRSNTTDFPNEQDPSALEDILDVSSSLKGLISRIYNIITSHGDNILDKIRAKWDDELGEAIPDGTWEEAVRRVNGTRSCARLSLIQFRVLHRIYFS